MTLGKLFGVATASLLLAASAGGAHALGFVNGGFEAGASTGWNSMTAANTPGWTIIRPTNDFFPALNLNQASGGPYGNNNEGRQFATLGGKEDSGASALEQTVSGFTIGKTYTLTWIQASEFSTAEDLQVSLTSGSATASQVFTTNNFPGGSQFWYGWTKESYSFVPTATAVTFHFQSFGVNSAGQTNYEPGIDNFQISTLGVPEPASWGLMLIGLGGVGAALRSRRETASITA